MSTLFEYFTGTLEEFLSLAKDMDGNRLMKIQLTHSTLPEYQGYRHVLDNYTVKHIMHRHSGKRERLRGQEPITLEDLQLISDIVLHADGITPVQCKNGNPGYIYTKSINEETFTLIEKVRNGHSELAVTTLYKRKKSSPTLRVLNDSADSGFAPFVAKISNNLNNPITRLFFVHFLHHAPIDNPPQGLEVRGAAVRDKQIYALFAR